MRKRRANVLDDYFVAALTSRVNIIDHGGFQPRITERKIVVDRFFIVEKRNIVLAFFRKSVDLGPARVRQAQQSCGLIERFADSVVARASEAFVIVIPRHVQYQRMPAAGDEREERRF